MDPESRIMCLWGPWTTSPENRKNGDYSILRLFAVNVNITTELLAFPVFSIVGENGPVDPVRPQIGFRPIFLFISYRILKGGPRGLIAGY